MKPVLLKKNIKAISALVCQTHSVTSKAPPEVWLVPAGFSFKGQVLQGKVWMFLHFLLFVCVCWEVSSWWREPFKELKKCVEMTSNCFSPAPLGKPAIILSGRIDRGERVKETVPATERGNKSRTERMFLSKSGWCVILSCSLKGWHFSNALFLTLAFQMNKSL